jgi:hypothetical protein
MLEHVARNASKSSDERKRHKEFATTEVGRDRKILAVISCTAIRLYQGRQVIEAGVWVVVSVPSVGLQGRDALLLSSAVPVRYPFSVASSLIIVVTRS